MPAHRTGRPVDVHSQRPDIHIGQTDAGVRAGRPRPPTGRRRDSPGGHGDPDDAVGGDERRHRGEAAVRVGRINEQLCRSRARRQRQLVESDVGGQQQHDRVGPVQPRHAGHRGWQLAERRPALTEVVRQVHARGPSSVRVTTASAPGRAARAGAGATWRRSSPGNRPTASQPAPPLVERNSASPPPAYQTSGRDGSTSTVRILASGASGTTNRSSSTRAAHAPRPGARRRPATARRTANRRSARRRQRADQLVQALVEVGADRGRVVLRGNDDAAAYGHRLVPRPAADHVRAEWPQAVQVPSRVVQGAGGLVRGDGFDRQPPARAGPRRDLRHQRHVHLSRVAGRPSAPAGERAGPGDRGGTGDGEDLDVPGVDGSSLRGELVPPARQGARQVLHGPSAAGRRRVGDRHPRHRVTQLGQGAGGHVARGPAAGAVPHADLRAGRRKRGEGTRLRRRPSRAGPAPARRRRCPPRGRAGRPVRRRWPRRRS